MWGARSRQRGCRLILSVKTDRAPRGAQPRLIVRGVVARHPRISASSCASRLPRAAQSVTLRASIHPLQQLACCSQLALLAFPRTRHPHSARIKQQGRRWSLGTSSINTLHITHYEGGSRRLLRCGAGHPGCAGRAGTVQRQQSGWGLSRPSRSTGQRPGRPPAGAGCRSSTEQAVGPPQPPCCCTPPSAAQRWTRS